MYYNYHHGDIKSLKGRSQKTVSEKDRNAGENTGSGNGPFLGDGLKGNVGDHQISKDHILSKLSSNVI